MILRILIVINKLDMKKRLIGVVIFVLFGAHLSAYAISEEELGTIQESVKVYQEKEAQTWPSQEDMIKNRVDKLKEMLIKSYESFEDAEKQINAYEEELKPIQESILTLKDQMKNIDLQLDQTQTKISNIELLIKKRETDIVDLMGKIEKSQIEMDEQKEMLQHYLTLSYFEEQKYNSEDDYRNLLNLLLADGASSEILQKEVYLNVMEDARRQVFFKLKEAQTEFQDNQAKYEKIRENLTNLKALSEKERENLKSQLLAKEDLLTQTEGQEKEYQRLLEESKLQQNESVFEIENLQNNLEIIRDKLQIFETNQIKTQTKIKVQPTGSGSYTENFIDLDESQSFFEWPVSPNGGITAYYQDEDYEKYFKVVHSAIDIRQRQGSPIFAPTNGYVYKVKDNGMGYSYLIIAHRDNVMSVYGHVSEFLVEEGELVHAGDMIGLTGGMPGTKGAGWMTTGPHLHFEVYKNGEHENPLDYLPLEELPIEYIPADYLKKIKLR